MAKLIVRSPFKNVHLTQLRDNLFRLMALYRLLILLLNLKKTYSKVAQFNGVDQSFVSIMPGARIKCLDVTSTAEVVSVSRLGADAPS